MKLIYKKKGILHKTTNIILFFVDIWILGVLDKNFDFE